jgi:hypothetical protein
VSLILDNSLYPCIVGAFFPQVELVGELLVTIQPEEVYYYGMQISVVVFVGVGSILLAGVGINLYRLAKIKRQIKELMKRKNIIQEPLLGR